MLMYWDQWHWRHSLIRYPPCSRQEGEPELQQSIYNVGPQSMDLCSRTGDKRPVPMPFGSAILFRTSAWKPWMSRGQRIAEDLWGKEAGTLDFPGSLSFARSMPFLLTMCRGKTKFFSLGPSCSPYVNFLLDREGTILNLWIATFISPLLSLWPLAKNETASKWWRSAPLGGDTPTRWSNFTPHGKKGKSFDTTERYPNTIQEPPGWSLICYIWPCRTNFQAPLWHDESPWTSYWNLSIPHSPGPLFSHACSRCGLLSLAPDSLVYAKPVVLLKFECRWCGQ